MARRRALIRGAWRPFVPTARVAREGGDNRPAYGFDFIAFTREESNILFSRHPAGTTVNDVLLAALALAIGRWNVEHALRVAKSELGFTHFEGRRYVALMRHLSLCLLTLTFVADQTDRLRGEKSRRDDGASVPGTGRTVPGLAAPAAADDGPGMHAAHHLLPPSTQPPGHRRQEEEGPRRQGPQEAATAA